MEATLQNCLNMHFILMWYEGHTFYFHTSDMIFGHIDLGIYEDHIVEYDEMHATIAMMSSL